MASAMPRLRRSASLGAIVKSLFLSLAGVALVLLVGVAASWPLWYLATRHAAAYALLLTGGALAFALRSAFRRREKGYL
jgi:hypothetical protein